MPADKENQISFTVDPHFKARVITAAEREEIPLANLSRKLLRAGFLIYEKYGLDGMRNFIESLPASSSGRSQRKGAQSRGGQSEM